MVKASVRLAVVETFAIWAATVSAQEIEVRECGQVVPDKTTGFLAADLDCTGFVWTGSGVAPAHEKHDLQHQRCAAEPEPRGNLGRVLSGLRCGCRRDRSARRL
jgi:hypothetical protein